MAGKFWNEENSAKVVDLYNESGKDNTKLKAIGQELGGLTENQVRCKLVSMKEYKPNEQKTTTGGASVVRKPQIVNQIETALGLDKDALESLGKANKSELENLLQAVSPPEKSE